MAIKQKLETPAQINARFRAIRMKIEATKKGIEANNRAFRKTVTEAEAKHSLATRKAFRELDAMSRELTPGRSAKRETEAPVITKRDAEPDYEFRNGPGSAKAGKTVGHRV